jgi:hypothetical protein
MMDEEKPKKERKKYTRKPSTPLVERPTAFMADEEFNLTDMQTAFVWHYVNDNCTQTEAARRAGFEFPAHAASKFLNGKDYPNVVKAIKVRREEMAHKYAITPDKTAKMLWKVSEEAYNKGQFNAAVSALRELNDMGGFKVRKSENLNINANLENLNAKEIERQLSEIFGGNIIDVEYDDV